MKITAPISRVEEISPLVEAGANEFYCSVLPPDWLERFNTSAISRRTFGNLPEFDDLEKAVGLAHSLDARLHLVLNAQQYTEQQSLALIELAEIFEAMSGDALILADPGLLYQVGQKDLNLSLHLSSIAGCRNRDSVKLFSELGVKRVIFPRDMTLKEMTSIAEELPEIEFETFILNDGCAFDEGNCHTIHLPGKLGGPICMDNYQTDYRTMDNSLPTPAASSLLEENDALYQHWLWHRFSCGFSVTEEGYPYGPCGLCAISTLFDAGISAVKIAGRDSPTERKVKSVQMVREVLDKYRLSGVAEHASDYAISLRKTPHLCDQGYMCYYPESRTVHSSSAADNLAPTKAERIKTLSL